MTVEKITVHFRKIELGPGGEIYLLRIEQGEEAIKLTREQALSLAKQITEKVHP